MKNNTNTNNSNQISSKILKDQKSSVPVSNKNINRNSKSEYKSRVFVKNEACKEK